MSSFYALRQVRKCIGIKRIGHCGTLDPLATGMLPVMIGQGTKYASLLNSQDKSYTVTANFGCISDTYDIEGQIIHSEIKKSISHDDIEKALGLFTGEILQQPPSFSAIRVDGKRAYELARQGELIELPKRKVTVHHIEVIDIPHPNSVQLRVICSKGTYIRSLVHDLGQHLGVGALVSQLHREWVAPFNEGKMIELDQLSVNDVEPLTSLFKQKIILNETTLTAIHHGQSIPSTQSFSKEPIALLDENHEFHGSGFFEDQRIYPKKLISQPIKQDKVATGSKNV